MQMRKFLVLIIAGAIACSEPAGHRETSGPVLADLTANVILPSFRDLDASAATLATAATALRDAPSADTLATAQTAWRAARKAWRHTDVLAFGPIVTKDVAPAIDFWPANGATIDAVVADSAPLDPAALGRLGANAKGFMALEYLLFDPAGGDAAVLASLSGTGAPDRRRALVALVADGIHAKTSEVAAAWDPTGENFAQKLTSAGAGSPAYASQKLATDEIVNHMIFAAESIIRAKLAKPLGKANGGTPQPALEETPRSDASLDDMRATLDGIESVYTGTYGDKTGNGIATLVRARNASLDERVNAAFASAEAAIGAVPPPMRATLAGDRAPLERAYDTTNGLKKLLVAEVASALGTTLRYGDSDGD